MAAVTKRFLPREKEPADVVPDVYFRIFKAYINGEAVKRAKDGQGLFDRRDVTVKEPLTIHLSHKIQF